MSEAIRDQAYGAWWDNTITGPDVPAVAHEAFCAGWEALLTKLGNEHHVVFTADRWTVEHSVECRLSGHMPECAYHVAIRDFADEYDPSCAGRWRITGIDSEGVPALERAE